MIALPSKRRLAVAGALVLLAVGSAGFSSTSLFDEPSSVGGGGGYAFTGSPTSHSMSCATCHQGTTRSDGIDLWSVPEGLFDVGYEPGQTYEIHIRLRQEVRGLGNNHACAAESGGCNRNGFVAEFLDSTHAPVGALCADGGTLGSDGSCSDSAGATTTLLASHAAISGNSLAQPVVCGNGVTTDCVDIAGMTAAGKSQAEINAALSAGVSGRTIWAFQWRAPGADVLATTMWLGAVDGDAGVSVDPAHNDFLGDEVLLVKQPLWARGHEPAAAASAACSARPRATAPNTGPTVLVGLLLLSLGLVATQRRAAPTSRDPAVGGRS